MRSSKRPKTCFEHTLKLQSKGRVYNDLQLARLLELKLKHAILEVDCLKLVQLLRQQDDILHFCSGACEQSGYISHCFEIVHANLVKLVLPNSSFQSEATKVGCYS